MAILFDLGDPTDPWRVIRRLGAGAAHLELWAEDDQGRLVWVQPDSPHPPDDVLLVLAHANLLPEWEVLSACRSFAIEYRILRERRVHWCEQKVREAQQEVRAANSALDHARVLEAAIRKRDDAVREIAVRLAPTWLNSPEELLQVAKALR